MALAIVPPARRFYPDGANKRIKVTADTDDIPSNKGFVVDAAGTLSCRLSKESALDDLPVLAGVVYPFDLVEVSISGSTGPSTVWVLQNV